jgi:hypothetical protein
MLRPPRLSSFVCALVFLVSASAHARGGADDPEREARRQELRQQLEAERERWRGEGVRRGAGRSGHSGHGSAYGPGQAADGPLAPAYIPGPGGRSGDRPGWSGEPRLTQEERRSLRRELRDQRP